MTDAFDAAIDKQRRMGLKRSRFREVNMTTQEDKKLEYKPPPPTRTDLGYTWNECDIQDVVESLGFYLARQKAKVFIQDVHATNNRVYRNILIQLPKLNEFFVAENISIRFDRDEGRQLSINRG